MAMDNTANGQAAINGDQTAHNVSPKIVLYTNHGCPFAQRAHITLDELDLAYEEVIIDLENPRPQWYLDINPRGLVPAIKYSTPGTSGEDIIAESAIVAQFLCDSFPSHLLPASNESPSAALARARIAFFCDTWSTKISPSQFAVMRATSVEEKEAKVKESIALLEKSIEPLLANADPFFGGSKDLTFAEVYTAPFVQRLVTLAEDGEMVPKALLSEMESLPNFSRWTKAVLEHNNVIKNFDRKTFLEGSLKRLKKLREMQQSEGAGV